jgi:cell division protein FtsW
MTAAATNPRERRAGKPGSEDGKAPKGAVAQAAVREHAGPDAQLFIATLALAAIGLVMVYSASFAKASAFNYTHHDSTYFMKRQAAAFALGLIAMFAAYRVSLPKVQKWAYGLLAVTAILLVAVLLVGVEVHGARRWFDLRVFRFQPSELAKLVVVIVAARFFADHHGRTGAFRALLPPIAMAAAVGLLIVLEHDLGTAIALVGGLMVIFSLGGARLRDLAIVVAVAVVAGIVFTLIEPYRLERVIAWLSTLFPWLFPEKEKIALEGAYQMNHSQLALGSGGPFGRGFCESRQKYFYLPAASTDCILAIIGEELGFIGCMALLGLFGWLAYRGMTVAHGAGATFPALLASGLTAMLLVQVAFNVAMVTGMIPTTGVPLPLISYGGTGMVFTLAGIGLIMNVSRRRSAGPRARTAPRRRTILEM